MVVDLIQLPGHQRCQESVPNGTPQTSPPQATPAKVRRIQVDVIGNPEEETQIGEVDTTVEYEGVITAGGDEKGGEKTAPEWKHKDKDGTLGTLQAPRIGLRRVILRG